MLADLWLGLGDHKRAIPHLEQLLIRWPENETRKKQLFNAKNAN
jgi:hypothetical protein